MSANLGRFVMLLVAWALALLLLCWGRLPAAWRRAVALVVSATGLAFLFLALNTAGEREAATTGAFLMGSRYVTGKAQASASLSYYVMTGCCLLLGTTGLAMPTATARRLADHWMASAVGLSLLVTLLRFLLEQAAAPAVWTWLVGLWMLPPVVGAFFWWRLGTGPAPWRRLVKALLVYALVVRAWVAALYIAATVFRLGSHYDLSAVVSIRSPFTGALTVFVPGSFSHLLNLAILPQLLFWPIYTVLAGLLGAGLMRLGSWAQGPVAFDPEPAQPRG
ncbi:MAG TPA: hypothetical protein VF310_13700 [Vicinamibacteria bacterium]